MERGFILAKSRGFSAKPPELTIIWILLTVADQIDTADLGSNGHWRLGARAAALTAPAASLVTAACRRKPSQCSRGLFELRFGSGASPWHAQATGALNGALRGWERESRRHGRLGGGGKAPASVAGAPRVRHT